MKHFRLLTLFLAFFLPFSAAFAHGSASHWPHFGRQKHGKSFASKHQKVQHAHHGIGRAPKSHSHKRRGR